MVDSSDKQSVHRCLPTHKYIKQSYSSYTMLLLGNNLFECIIFSSVYHLAITKLMCTSGCLLVHKLQNFYSGTKDIFQDCFVFWVQRNKLHSTVWTSENAIMVSILCSKIHSIMWTWQIKVLKSVLTGILYSKMSVYLPQCLQLLIIVEQLCLKFLSQLRLLTNK